MKNDIRDIEHQEATAMFIDGKARARKLARKTKLENTLQQIKASDPRGKIKGRELDAVKKIGSSFEEEIRKRNPTVYDDEQALKGRSTINPTKQGHQAKSPCIQLKDDKEIEFATSCNMKISADNKVSMDDMTRGRWRAEEIVGDEPDHTRLKRDVPYGHVSKSNQVTVNNLPPDMVMVKAGK
jgi:hypothetical protein